MTTNALLTGVLIMITTLLAGEKSSTATPPPSPKSVATFAGGCFWCMETPFAHLPGVSNVVSGYTGGTTENPTYDEVSSGRSGHIEAVQVTFNPNEVSYKELLEVFWRNINPTDAGGQFADRGKQYITAIFYHNEMQKNEATASRNALEASQKFEDAIVTTVRPARPFYPAEAYHQEYYKKNPAHYKQYREGSGRAPFLRRMWEASNAAPSPLSDSKLPFKRPADAVLKTKLTKTQYDVAVCSATEPPFKNEFWDNHREGIYVDIISGEPLFSSKDKFNSGTGWPSFTRPLDTASIVEKVDGGLGMERIEVRSNQSDAHLGHLFPDGPAPTGMRYCINSASLRFIPKEELEKEGYGRFVGLFE